MCTQSCKDEHAKTIEYCKDLKTNEALIVILVGIFLIGCWNVFIVGCLTKHGCGAMCKLFILMLVVSLCTFGIGALIWWVCWMVDCYKATK